MSGQIDVVMGSFSKVFAFNGGFVSCNSPAVKQYLKFYGSSATFCNALSPVQAATVTKAFEIVQSDRGRELRRLLLKRVGQMRSSLTAVGLKGLAIRPQSFRFWSVMRHWRRPWPVGNFQNWRSLPI